MRACQAQVIRMSEAGEVHFDNEIRHNCLLRHYELSVVNNYC